MSILIRFNQKNMTCETGIYLEQLLIQQGYQDNYFAVAINQNFIPKAQYAHVKIQADDHIDIVTPMQGG